MTHCIRVLLDDETRAAARDLALQFGVTVTEAIRRSVIRERDLAIGVPVERRFERTQALSRAYELFEGNDPAAEVRRLKAHDAGF